MRINICTLSLPQDCAPCGCAALGWDYPALGQRVNRFPAGLLLSLRASIVAEEGRVPFEALLSAIRIFPPPQEKYPYPEQSEFLRTPERWLAALFTGLAVCMTQI